MDAWKLESHKTKALRQALTKLDGDTRTMLLVEMGANRNLELASRNLEGVKLVQPRLLAPYDLRRHDRLIVSRDAATKLGSSLDPERPAAAPLVETIAPAPPAPKAAKPAQKKAAKPAAAKAKKPAKSPKAKSKD